MGDPTDLTLTYPDTEGCACDTCKAYCLGNPGYGTPAEIAALIESGHGNRLMLDWWDEDEDLPYTEVLAPASVGYERGYAPAENQSPVPWLTGWIKGPCAFLTADLQCSIYDQRPIECRAVRHDVQQPGIPLAVVSTWNTDEGRDLVKRWCRDYMPWRRVTH